MELYLLTAGKDKTANRFHLLADRFEDLKHFVKTHSSGWTLKFLGKHKCDG